MSVVGALIFLYSVAAFAAEPAEPPAQILEIEGTVELSRRPEIWDPAHTNQVLLPGDQLRTGERSRAVVRLSSLSVVRLGESTYLRMPPVPRGSFGLLRGLLYFFHRDKPGEYDLRTPTLSAVVRGTEFNVHVAEDGTTTLHLIDGVVDMQNEFGQLELQSGQAGLVEPGKPPVTTAAITTVNVIQWCLYYPGILHLGELELTADENQALSESLAGYRSGDLLAALAKYPVARQPTSDRERVYLAGLLLAVGQVERAERMLSEIGRQRTEDRGQKSEVRDQRSEIRGQRAQVSGQWSVVSGQWSAVGRLGEALRKLIAAVKNQPHPAHPAGETAAILATEWLAESYDLQSQSRLDEALAAARKALAKAEDFAFGQARVAELEFSFGRIDAASEALAKSLALAPRNAQAMALQGFLLSAQNKIGEAITYFDRALAIDGGLGNAWLGRGLCRIRQGQTEKGRQDLQVAATVEPQRAALRSYLGKAFSQAKDNQRASQELDLAKRMDPNDPTSWLYSALLNQQRNRVNEAIRDLEQSQALNDNRSVYRSRLMLDQDRAVRGANLATIYQDAGLTDVSLWEASRAVTYDYANFSAHWFLANSYNTLRDPKQISLRYETPWLSEYLVANLLAPVGAGTLSPQVSQQEYSSLFERERLGFVSDTEYLSRGAWFESAAQYGHLRNSAYALEAAYRSDPGQRPNEDLEQLTLNAKFKQQITPQDSVYLQAVYYDAESGDVAQYYDPYLPFAEGGPNLGLKTKENQEPTLLLGYHHQWRPGLHTLFLGGRIDDTFRVSNPNQETLLLGKNAAGSVTEVQPITIEQKYRSETELYTAELQQIAQIQQHTLVLGGRYQNGEFETRNQHTNASFAFPFLFPNEPETVDPGMERISLYAYDHWRVVPPLVLVAGVSYDRLRYPENFRYAPLSDVEDTEDQVSPKAGLIWTPAAGTTLRGAYTRSLGGVSFDQSFRLEPTQVAGFNQAFRSLMPESVVGAIAGAPFDTWGVSLEHAFPHGTYLGIGGQILQSDADRWVGTYDFLFPFTVQTSQTRQKLDYEERSLTVVLYQLLAEEWSLGALYRVSQAELESRFVGIPETLWPEQDEESVLHQVNLFLRFTHPCGFFGQFESVWNQQHNDGYAGARPGDEFWQFNLYAGYRFYRRRAELTLGLLNISDQDYMLNPLNLSPDYPRERTLSVRFRFSF